MLVVDDDEMVRQLIAVNLVLEGFDVTTAVDGRDCLDKVAAAAPDVITLDLSMPRLDGWETGAQLRTRPVSRHVKIVLITASTEEEKRPHAVQVHADAHLAKPFDPADLIRLIRQLTGTTPAGS